jgi:hypothetical protein
MLPNFQNINNNKIFSIQYIKRGMYLLSPIAYLQHNRQNMGNMSSLLHRQLSCTSMHYLLPCRGQFYIYSPCPMFHTVWPRSRNGLTVYMHGLIQAIRRWWWTVCYSQKNYKYLIQVDNDNNISKQKISVNRQNHFRGPRKKFCTSLRFSKRLLPI